VRYWCFVTEDKDSTPKRQMSAEKPKAIDELNQGNQVNQRSQNAKIGHVGN